MSETDPYLAFRFIVEIGGIRIGGFSQVSGIERDTTFEEFREGGVNDHVHKLVTLTKHPNLTLQRGITDAQELWRWHQEVIDGDVKRKSVAVELQGDRAGRLRWVFSNAYPVKWSVGDFEASNSAVAVESVEFAYERVTLS